MTSLAEHAGRPEVDPWLRGWQEPQPQTRVVWRHWLAEVADANPESAVASFLEAAPPHFSEKLEVSTDRVVDWLAARCDAVATRASKETLQISGGSTVAVVLGRANQLERALTLDEANIKGDPRRKRQFLREFQGATLVVDRLLSGLSCEGLLDDRSDEPCVVADTDEPWLEPGDESAPVIRFRLRETGPSAETTSDASWRERLRLPLAKTLEGEVLRWLVIDRWRQDAETEDDRSTTTRPQSLVDHQAMAERKAREIVRRLAMPDSLAEVLAIAARLHDEGKKAARWQEAFSAARGQSDDVVVMAKTRGPLNVQRLDGYRHEFGSLPHAEADEQLRQLPDELRSLVLHLIVAHHGFGRPWITTRGCDDAPPSALQTRAREVALRYAALQEDWGPWGLAYLETLLRAADQQASRENDEGGAR
jgi:CRISPR-associated endonuclease/helicase Cas3